jgi:hypothetical protein
VGNDERGTNKDPQRRQNLFVFGHVAEELTRDLVHHGFGQVHRVGVRSELGELVGHTQHHPTCFTHFIQGYVRGENGGATRGKCISGAEQLASQGRAHAQRKMRGRNG